MAWRAVSDKQWEAIKPHLPKRKRSRKGGRPPIDDRKCFEGILWILWTGAPWSELPERYGSKSAVHRRLKEWTESKVRAILAKRGIEPIIPARSNNTVATHQDGRKMRRYKRRWIIERSNSWLQNFRKLAVRYERSEKIFAAFVHMACALITLKKVL